MLHFFISLEIWSNVLSAFLSSFVSDWQPECLYARAPHKDLWAKGRAQNTFLPEKYDSGDMQPLDSLPPYQNRANLPCLSLFLSVSLLFHLPLIACFLSSFSNLRCACYRQHVQTIQRATMILQCCWHCLTWAGLWMGHTRWHRLWLWMGAQTPAGVSISADFTNLHSTLLLSFFYRQLSLGTLLLWCIL